MQRILIKKTLNIKRISNSYRK